MPERYSIGSPLLSVSGARPSAQRTDESPFRILVLGDFSGRGSRGLTEPVRGRSHWRVDLDKFDAVMAKAAPQLELSLPAGEKIILTFSKLDDFHPDRIWEQHQFFEPHRKMRAELSNPATFAAAMSELKPQEQPGGTEAVAPSPADEAADLWKQLTDLPASKPASSSPSAAVRAMIENAVTPHLVSGPDPRQADTIAAFDAAVSGQMRAILHHPHFQALEAAWRGVDFLLRNVDTDDTLEVALFDVSRDELAADLRADGSVSGTVEFIVEKPIGTKPWTVIAGLYSFQPGSEDDADLLARLAQVAAAARSPFIAGAGPAFVAAAEARTGESEVPAAWQTARNIPAARHAGLVAPRFLLRLPYGKSSDPIESFPFEEMPSKLTPNALLWGNGSLIAAVLLANAWRDEGWGFSAPVNAAVSGLPVHLFTESGEKKSTPCGEILLTDRSAENLLALGIMPLASVRDRDSVRLLRFQSIAQPPAGLAGL